MKRGDDTDRDEGSDKPISRGDDTDRDEDGGLLMTVLIGR